MRNVLCLFAVSLAGGCAIYQLTPTTKQVSAKPADCEFVVVTTRVERPYEEIGILDRSGPMMIATTAQVFKDEIREQVCSIGGDAVFAQINGNGSYIRGTVLRWKKESPAVPGALKTPAETAGPASTPAPSAKP